MLFRSKGGLCIPSHKITLCVISLFKLIILSYDNLLWQILIREIYETGLGVGGSGKAGQGARARA